MALKKEIAGKIKDLLQQNPKGLSISDIVRKININRNTAGRYLENLMVSGQVEMRHFGMAKIYKLAQRVPLSAMLSISSELIMLLDNNLRVIYTNEPMLTFLETSQKEIYGKNIEFTSIITMFNGAYNWLIKGVKNGLKGVELKEEITSEKKGIVFSCHISPTVFEEGQRGVSILLEDITEEKRVEEALRQSEATARALIDAPTDTILLLNSKGEILELNKTAALRFGKTKDELIGVLADHILPDEIARERRSIINQVLKKKSMVRFEDKRDGMWFDTVAYPIILENGEVNKIAIIARDITVLKQRDEELRKSEQRYRTLAETSHDLIFIIDRDDRVVYVNSYAATALGKATDQIIGQPRSTLFSRELSLRQQEGLRHVLGSGKLFRSEGAMAVSGQNRWFDHFLMPIIGDGKTVTAILGISRDITERQILEESQRQLKDKHRYLIMNSSDIIWESDAQSRFVFVSPQVERILGYLPEDWIGHTPFEFFDKGAYEPNMLKLLDELMTKKEGFVYPTRWIHKNGSIVILESHVIPLYKKDDIFAGFCGIERYISNRDAI